MWKMITHDRLLEVLRYEPDTGLFWWKIKTSNRCNVKKPAGSINNGYVLITVDGIRYRAHRLAWVYINKKWPPDFIDHINGNRTDNRIANLREVDCKTNNENLRESRSNNKTGYLGVSYFKPMKKYRASIQASGKLKHLGYFDDPEEAHAVYLAAKRQLHGGCTI